MSTASTRRRGDDLVGQVHVYEPHVVGLPPLASYFRELWRRRPFIVEMARTTLRAQNYQTVFGQAWLVLNPLLLGLVYWLLVDILRGGQHRPHSLTDLLGALFAYNFFSTAVSDGAKSVTGGGKLVLNTAFPRLMLPLAAVLTAFQRFLPTMAIYAIAHLLSHLPVGPHLLYVIPVFALLALFTTGMAILFSVLQVYFRDTRSFLPYLLRIWLYVSPVLYTADRVPAHIRHIIRYNPLFLLIGAWTDALTGKPIPLSFFVSGAAWGFGALVVGTLFFLSREREFAVRL